MPAIADTPPERAQSVSTIAGPLYLPDDDSIIRPYLEREGVWAPEITRLVRARVRRGMTFVDVGAHVGYFTVLAAKLVGPSGAVFAFEPHPRNFKLLSANTRRNGLENVKCFPFAVSDSEGDAELFEAESNTGDHRLYRSDDGYRRALRVRTVRLDSVSEIRTPVGFVKIDVQGQEPAVMRGMEGLLRSSPDAIVALEFWPYGLRQTGVDPRGALGFYRGLGYDVCAHSANAGPLESLADDQILSRCEDWEGFGHVDLVLRRLESPI
jgi:FkbM family methyltransferase